MNPRTALPMLLLAATPVAAAPPASSAETPFILLGSAEDVPFRTDATIAAQPNKAVFSRIGLRSTTDRAVITDASVTAAIDNDVKSAATLPADGSMSLELRFIGQPRWINRVELSTDAQDLAVEVLQTDGRWRHWGTASRAGGTLVVQGEAGRWMGLRVTPRGVATSESVQVRDVYADLVQHDPDTQDRAEGDGKSYLYEAVENYSSSPLSKTIEDARGLRDALPGDWDVQGWTNSLAWEQDFKRVEYGGTNNDFADEHDLVFFSGHGSTGTGEYYSDSTRCVTFSDDDWDDRKMTAGDAHECWGDDDMEWLGMSACQTMKQPARWASAFAGAHLIMGWKTNMYDIEFGKHFGQRMVDSGWFDSAYPVKESWFWAAEKTHGHVDRTARVVGENGTMGSDYLWGEGTVHSDPTVDNYYTYWTFDTRGREEAAPPAPLADAIEIAGAAMTIRVERDLLASLAASGRQSMPVFKTIPPDVDADAAAAMADSLCQRLGLLCGADVGPDGEQAEVIAVQGDHEARIWIADGSVDIVDRAVLMPSDPTATPSLPSTQDAYEKAEVVLAAIGIPMEDRDWVGQDLFWMDSQLSKDDPDASGQSVATRTRIIYRRQLAGYPTFGPGGEATVEFGDQGRLAKASVQAWTAVEPSGDAGVLDFQETLEQLAEQGGPATLNGARMPLSDVEVRDVQLGYWLETAGDGQPHLLPTYGIRCLVYGEDGDSSEVTLCMSAATPAPSVSVSGHEQNCFAVGETVCLDAHVETFDGQMQVRWINPATGAQLGNDLRLCAAFTQSDPARPTRTRSVKVEVRDSLGFERSTTVDVCVGDPTDVNGDQRTDINDLLTILGAWGQQGSPWSGGDATGDGLCDINDVLAVLSGWSD